MTRPTLLMTDPSHYDVSYMINPWMRPDAWNDAPELNRRLAAEASAGLAAALRDAGAELLTIAGWAGLPDMVFPANAAVVMDGRAMLARFRFPERQGEEEAFRSTFSRLVADGLLRETATLPDGVFQEGAGDCIWDRTRGHFWAGHGPRSSGESVGVLRDFFGREIVALELVNPRFYHLDTCLCVLPRGEVLFYPPAFSPDGLAAIHDIVSPEQRIEATDDDAARFCVNAVALGDVVVMAEASDTLRGRLSRRGYRVSDVGLAPFILSGGGAYCMTLRLDLRSGG